MSRDKNTMKITTLLETQAPQATIIRDEAKIIEQIEKTKRLKLWLPYGLTFAFLAAVTQIWG